MQVVRTVHGYHEALKLLIFLVARLALVFRVLFRVGRPAVTRDAAEASPVVWHRGTATIALGVEVISAAHIGSERATIELIIKAISALARFGSFFAHYKVVVVDQAVALSSTAHTSPPELRRTFASS